MVKSREIFTVCPFVYEEREKSEKEKKKTGKEHPESNPDGIGRTTGSCNLVPSLTRRQRNTTPIPSKAKRRSADIPAGTGPDFINRHRRRPTFSVLFAYLYTPPGDIAICN